MPAGRPHKLWANIEESATRQVTTTGAPVLPDMFYPQVINFYRPPHYYFRIVLYVLPNIILNFDRTCPETKFCNRVMIKMASSFYLRKPNIINIGSTINIILCRSTVPWHNNISLQRRNAE